jgi:hypothetical protein
MSPTSVVDVHPFYETLHQWETGVPVDCGEPWAWETIEAAVAQGAHQSATTAESIALIAEDVAYQVKAGYAQIISWEELQQLRPRNLKVSPLAVVPQRNRRGRMILDLSFAVRRQTPNQRGRKRNRAKEVILQPSVNDTTTRLAPQGPVKELGNVLPRILNFMATVPPEEHIHFSKLDLADGFWRMIVEPDERWNFCYVMPTPPGTPTQIVIPGALQMGWAESPAYFCATTETVRDVAQSWVDAPGLVMEPHVLEHFVEATTPARRQTSDGPKHQMSAVYVDDFLGACVENTEGTLLQKTARATLHAIHSVFPSPAATGTPDAKDPVSIKKLQKGDGRWDTRKEVLGYMLDGIRRTVQLPTDRAEDLLKEIRSILRKQRVPIKRFRSIAGRLQHAARILPAARAFFTPINMALRGMPSFVGLCRNGETRHALIDVAAVIRNLAHRPTHVSELVQGTLDYAGYCDASAFGAGGVWFGGEQKLAPIVWRVEWPKDITAAVVSDSHPGGTLTNSDLEMAGVLLHELVLESVLGPKMQGAQVAIGCDNSPAVAWSTRMASRSATPISYRLLKGLAMRQRTTRSAPPAVFHVAGVSNTLADVASRPIVRSATEFHLLSKSPSPVVPNEFLNHFNSLYPLPQMQLWHSVPPPSVHLSNVISTLRGQRLALPQWTTALGPPLGEIGHPTPDRPASTPTCATTVKHSNKPTCLPLPPGFDLASSAMASKLEPSLWRRPYVTWHKPSSWLGTMIHGGRTAQKS